MNTFILSKKKKEDQRDSNGDGQAGWRINFFFLNNDIANKIYNFLLIKKTYLIGDF